MVGQIVSSSKHLCSCSFRLRRSLRQYKNRRGVDGLAHLRRLRPEPSTCQVGEEKRGREGDGEGASEA